ncbi:MAG TPA: hypothetical protein ENK57_01240, partial [Polyangiaceae bacterium]|nr:hypothetical protein [Polyangiaceae bacterium]
MTSDAGSASVLDKARLRTIALGAGYLVAIGAALQLARSFFSNPTTGVMIGAMIVAFITGHAGLSAEEGGPAARRRALVALALVSLPIIASIAVAVLLGASLPIGSPGMSAVFGIAEAIAVGYVAEAWLHGLPLLYADRAGVPVPIAVAYAVTAGVGVMIFAGPIQPAGIVLAIAYGTFFSLLWLRTGDAWAPVTAHVAWVWACDGLLRGDVFDLGPQAGRLTHALEARGAVAWVAAAGFGVLAWAVAS